MSTALLLSAALGVLAALGWGLYLLERRRSHAALNASEAKFATAFHRSPDAIMLTSVPDGKLLEVNESFTRMTGHDRQDVIDRTVQDLGLWSKTEHREQLYQMLQAHGFVHDFEMVYRTAHGEDRWGLASAEILRIDGRPTLLSVVRDITQLKEAQADRETVIAELEVKNAELERFTYTVSHDLKSPLFTIRGFLGMLIKDAENGDLVRVAEDAGRIRAATDRMKQLLDELLELSRVGRQMNPPQKVDLAKLAREAVDDLAGEINAAKVRIDLDSRLPTVSGDRIRLLEIFQNLLSNAIKFLGEQSAPKIEIGVRRQRGEQICFVSDNGMGIEACYHEKVFDLFERLDPVIPGTGIGLALVKRIVEVHGGRIWVESEGRGCGTTFFFTLGGLPAD